MPEAQNGIKSYIASGFNMEPFVLDGDEIMVNTSSDLFFRAGDILLYQSELYPEPVAHRFTEKKGREFILRSDAVPNFQDAVPREAILGRVESLRRGGSLISLTGSPVVGLINRLIVLFYPVYFSIKNSLAYLLEDQIVLVQRSVLYRKTFYRFFTPELAVIPLNRKHQYQILARLHSQFAGSISLERKEIDSKTVGWISSLYIRMRYRGFGVATSLLKAAEDFVRSQGLEELWVSYDRNNHQAGALYKKREFQFVKTSDSLFRDEMVMKKDLKDSAKINDSNPIHIS